MQIKKSAETEKLNTQKQVSLLVAFLTSDIFLQTFSSGEKIDDIFAPCRKFMGP